MLVTVTLGVTPRLWGVPLFWKKKFEQHTVDIKVGDCILLEGASGNHLGSIRTQPNCGHSNTQRESALETIELRGDL